RGRTPAAPLGSRGLPQAIPASRPEPLCRTLEVCAVPAYNHVCKNANVSGTPAASTESGRPDSATGDPTMRPAVVLSQGLLAWLVLSGLARAAGSQPAPKPQTIEVWPAKAPGEKGDLGPEKAERTKSVTRITNVTQPTLTVYRPAKAKDTGTAVVIAPGGGYNLLAWDLEGEEVARWLNSLGVTGIVLKYRVPRRA